MEDQGGSVLSSKRFPKVTLRAREFFLVAFSLLFITNGFCDQFDHLLPRSSGVTAISAQLRLTLRDTIRERSCGTARLALSALPAIPARLLLPVTGPVIG